MKKLLYPDTAYTRELYEKTGVTSGSVVACVIKNFDDGSVKKGLDKRITGVSVVYGALGMVQIVCNNRDSIPLKYEISSVQVLKNQLNIMLMALKNENYHSDFVEHIWDGIE